MATCGQRSTGDSPSRRCAARECDGWLSRRAAGRRGPTAAGLPHPLLALSPSRRSAPRRLSSRTRSGGQSVRRPGLGAKRQRRSCLTERGGTRRNVSTARFQSTSGEPLGRPRSSQYRWAISRAPRLYVKYDHAQLVVTRQDARPLPRQVATARCRPAEPLRLRGASRHRRLPPLSHPLGAPDRACGFPRPSHSRFEARP
jgi:hypothetical protein